MEIKTSVTECKEVFVDAGNFSVTVNAWSNLEGCNLMVNGDGKGMPLRMAGSFRWNEIDVIIAALAVARAV